MKVLNNSDYDKLKAAADNYQAVVDKMVEAGANADEITPESILEAMTPAENDDSSAVEELTTQINTLTTERDDLQQRAEKAEARVSELEALPAVEPAGGKTPKKSDTAESSLDEVNEFAKSHAKDQASVIEMVRKSGIV